MKKAVLLFALSALCLHLHAQVIPYQELSRPEQKPGTDLEVYFETPHDLIVVRRGYISHQSKNYNAGGSGGYTAQPARYSSQTVLEGMPLNGNQLLALKDRIKNAGLLILPKALGAPASEHGEDYIIRVRIDGRAHSFLYRRNASFPSAPGAFSQVSEYLWWLITEVEQ
jgi:hypothetical protein